MTVIMDRKDYLERMSVLLNDHNTYRSIKKDPIKQITSKLSNLIKSWKNNDLIDEFTYRFLNCTNGNLPRCYGLPKVHKADFPLRIIVSSIGSPSISLTTYIK